MRLKPPIESSKFGYKLISGLLKERSLTMDTHSEKDMDNCTHHIDLNCDLSQQSLFCKETYVNEELPETSSSKSVKVLCDKLDSGWADALEVSSEVSIVEDIYFEDDYLQDYNYPIYGQSIQSPQSSLKCGIKCINNSKCSSDHLVLYEDYILYDGCEDDCIQGCDPWPVLSPFLNLKLRKESINSFHDTPGKNFHTQEVSKEPCTMKQSSRRKHHSAPDILCHDNYILSCCQDKLTQYDSAIEEILSNSLLGLQIAFDCSLIDSIICGEDICNCTCLLQGEMCANKQCRTKLEENMQTISDTLSSPHTISELKLLSGEYSVVSQHKYNIKISSSLASNFISKSDGLDTNNFTATDKVDNEIQTSFHQKDREPCSAVGKIFQSYKPERQCDVFASSNDISTENISPVLQKNVPLTPNIFPCKETGLASIPSNVCFLNLTLHCTSPLTECKFVTTNRMSELHQRLCILYVHLIAALLVPINADYYSATRVDRNILLTVTIAHQRQDTSTKGHFMNPNKKHTRKKTTLIE